ncbi:interleukin enhancer-binding factor 3 [Aspergillus brasiliensis]|uniref:Interleukin enhancer-binding factor 3 n=1 Tax=Aspergillus brasiliensis TaxID=319629 RepID=A0A9W6DKV7_9EURO|nr:interleukin enhancer-binding factor 3 [Aspergillus brasiliensis]GKZ42287.1 interleukin enhancer-binding factor 3 [Aspergillus brasiliensis]
MSNLMHKVKDALTGHHNNSNSRKGSHGDQPSMADYNTGGGRYGPGDGSYSSQPSSENYSSGDYERRTDTYGSGTGGEYGGNYGSQSSSYDYGNTGSYGAGSGDYGQGTERYGGSGTEYESRPTNSEARQGFGGSGGDNNYSQDTGSYEYSPTNRLDSGKMGYHSMGPDNVRSGGTQRNQW